MVCKFFMLAALVAVAQAGVVAPVAPVVAAKLVNTDFDPNPQYTYAYDVQDTLTGDSKNQFETRDGDVVRGRYSLIEADGTRRIVDYTADPINGFNAVVQREPAVVKAAVVAPAVPVAAPVVAKYVAPAPVAKFVAAPAPLVAPVAKYAAPVAKFISAPAPFAKLIAAPAPLPFARVAAAPIARLAAPLSYPAPLAYSAPFAKVVAPPLGYPAAYTTFA